jgi:hypothetical protein
MDLPSAAATASRALNVSSSMDTCNYKQTAPSKRLSTR